MPNTTNRSAKVVADFFTTLLEEKPTDTAVVVQPLELLLARVNESAPEVDVSIELIDPRLLNETVVQPTIEPPESNQTPKEALSIESIDEVEILAEITPSALLENSLIKQLDDSFPVLYFTVYEHTFAIPLIKLKGIHPLRETTKLIGKPDWFSGIQIEREQNLNVIDTGKYLLPEKSQSQLEHCTNYKYIIVLGDSNWALKCHTLVDSSQLTHQEIKWRTEVRKSPWLAGTVKQRMCGLLAVDALIELFEMSETT